MIVLPEYVPTDSPVIKKLLLSLDPIAIEPLGYMAITPIVNCAPDAIRAGIFIMIEGLISGGSGKFDEVKEPVEEPLLVNLVSGKVIVMILFVPSKMYLAVYAGDVVPKNVAVNVAGLTIRVYVFVSNVASPLTNPDPVNRVASPFIIELALLVVKVPLPNTT